MGSSKIRIKNQSPKPQQYAVSLDEISILESAKNVLVSPVVKPGTSHDIVIDDKYYVWAKLDDSSGQVTSSVDVGGALVLESDGKQAVIRRVQQRPDAGCFSVSIHPSFLDHGIFGLGLMLSSSNTFHRLTTTDATEVATYNIQPSRVYEVSVNSGYQDGEELTSNSALSPSVTVNLQTGERMAIVIHSIKGSAEILSAEEIVDLKKAEEERQRLSKEAELKVRQAAAAAEQKRVDAERAQKAAAEKFAAEKAQNAAADKAAADLATRLQNMSIISGHSVAATAWSSWHMRIYFQDGRGAIRESRHDDGIWSGGDAYSAITVAKMGTPLSAICWDGGRQIRLYYVSSQDTLQEHCYTAGHGWYQGQLRLHSARVASYSKVSAIHWAVDTSLRVYYQEPGSTAIQEYCYSDRVGWTRGSTLWNAVAGSSIAATRWMSGALDSVHRNLHIRIYYQDETSYIRELCWKFGGWSMGGFRQWAPRAHPIAAIAWHDYQVNIRVFWLGSQKTLHESVFNGAWTSPSSITSGGADETCSFTVIELQNGMHYRLYMREHEALVEKCNGKYGGHWFNGAFLVR